MASTAFTLDMLMIAPPPPCFTIWRAAAWPARNTPFRFTARTRSKSTSSMSRNSAAWTMPALATRMSRRPNFSTVAATARSTADFLETSHAVPAADLPTLAAAAWTAPSLRSTSMTFAPSATKAWAQANPIPCAAPVTRATLSRSFMRLFADGLHRVEVHRRIARLGGTGGGPDRVHEFGAELVLHRGAVLLRECVDVLAIILGRRAHEVLVDELLVLGVLGRATRDGVDVLPAHQEPHEGIGEGFLDGTRVAVAELAERLLEV